MLSPDRAEQFHAVYKGVVAPGLFTAMVQELASGEASQHCCAGHVTQNAPYVSPAQAAMTR